MEDFKGLSKGQILYKLRQLVGVTQKDIADYVGLAFVTISKYEDGTRNWSPKTAGLLVNFFVGKVPYSAEQLADLLAVHPVRQKPVNNAVKKSLHLKVDDYRLIKALATAKDTTITNVVSGLLESAEKVDAGTFAKARKIVKLTD